ncbi:MAG: hypothetical protein R6U96_07195 [Promethearchaeia archaeon]
MLSGNPANLMESQLSFSAAYMRQYYTFMADLNVYHIAETLDYGFMMSYGLLFLALCS